MVKNYCWRSSHGGRDYFDAGAGSRRDASYPRWPSDIGVRIAMGQEAYGKSKRTDRIFKIREKQSAETYLGYYGISYFLCCNKRYYY